MLPTIHVFGRTIAMYGLMIALGLVVGITIAVVRSKRFGFKPEDTLFASLFAGIGLFIGAKLLYILQIMPELISHLTYIYKNPSLLAPLFAGGFVFYGGLAGAAAGYYIYCRIYRLPYLGMISLVIPSVPIMHSFGRLGCFLAGCCYGVPYHGPGHVIFHLSNFAPSNIPLFPTQLTESILNLLAGIFLLLYAKPSRRPGNVLGVYLIYYSVMRFLMEYLRGDIARGILLGLSTSQWISLVLLPVGIWLILGIKPLRSKRE